MLKELDSWRVSQQFELQYIVHISFENTVNALSSYRKCFISKSQAPSPTTPVYAHIFPCYRRKEIGFSSCVEFGLLMHSL